MSLTGAADPAVNAPPRPLRPGAFGNRNAAKQACGKKNSPRETPVKPMGPVAATTGPMQPHVELGVFPTICVGIDILNAARPPAPRLLDRFDRPRGGEWPLLGAARDRIRKGE